MRTRRIVTSEQRMAKVGEFGAMCPLCPEGMGSFEVTDANGNDDTIHVEGACPVHGYVSGWTRRFRS